MSVTPSMRDLEKLERDHRLMGEEMRVRRLLWKRITRENVKKAKGLPIDEMQLFKDKAKRRKLTGSIRERSETLYRKLEKCYRTPEDIFQGLPSAAER